VREVPAAGEIPGVRQVSGHWEVRNLESHESDLEACSPAEFAERLRVTLAKDAGAAVEVAGAEVEDGQELRPGELWPWLWLVLVVCLLAEGILANRTVA